MKVRTQTIFGWILCHALALVAGAQTTRALADQLDFGIDGLPIPPMIVETATSPRTVQLLGEALRSEKLPSRRAQLVNDLGQCGLPDVIPHLVLSSGDATGMVRAETARTLGSLGLNGPQALEMLKKLAADPDPQVRREAIVAAAALHQPGLVALGLQDKDADVLSAAIDSASTSEHGKVIAAALASYPVPLQPGAIMALGRIADPQARAIVVGQVNGASPPVRAAAVGALAELKATSDRNTLAQIARNDSHPMVRRQAVLAVAQLADPAGAQELALAALVDPDWSVRSAAADVLGMFPTPEAITPLVAQLEFDQPELHESVRKTLIKEGSPAVPSAQALLEHPDVRSQKDGAIILGGLRSNASLQRRIALLKSPDLDLVTAVAESLGRSGDYTAGPALHELLTRLGASDHPNSPAAMQVILACGRIGYQPALFQIKAYLSSGGRPSRLQRAAAAWAFGALGNASDQTGCQQLVAMCNDPFEFEVVKFECIKALGEVRYIRIIEQLKSWSNGEDLGQSASLKWIAHRSLDRITGTPTPYSPPVLRQAPLVSISDLTPR